jgi:hypothetical protein
MESKEYNGWYNFETWNCSLWIDNEQGLQEMFMEVAEHYREDVGGLASYIEEQLRESEIIPSLGATFAGDMIETFVREINFDEIAEHIIADLDPLEIEGN